MKLITVVQELLQGVNSLSADSPSDETLNRGPLALLLRRQYEFPFGINIVQFSFFFIRRALDNKLSNKTEDAK